MSDLMNLEDAKQSLRQLTLLSLDANRALFDGLQTPDAAPSPERRATLNRIVGDLKPMREGFMMAVRASDVNVESELRYLISLLVDWTWLEDLGLRWTTDQPLERPTGQVVLYQHAVIAMGILPSLPRAAVTHPSGTYTDIPVPTTPGATLTRLQELENTVYAASSEPVNALSRGAVRRTYGFFEATIWLIANHLGNAIGW